MGSIGNPTQEIFLPGTYHLAFRNLPEIIAEHMRRGRALDFGCGADRSTRFLCRLGFEAVVVDVSSNVIRKAMLIDLAGNHTSTHLDIYS